MIYIFRNSCVKLNIIVEYCCGTAGWNHSRFDKSEYFCLFFFHRVTARSSIHEAPGLYTKLLHTKTHKPQTSHPHINHEAFCACNTLYWNNQTFPWRWSYLSHQKTFCLYCPLKWFPPATQLVLSPSSSRIYSWDIWHKKRHRQLRKS